MVTRRPLIPSRGGGSVPVIVGHRRAMDNPFGPGRSGCEHGAMVVRAARDGDERDLAVVRVRGWQQGYDGLIDASFLAAMSIEESTVRWAGILEQQTGLRRTLVIETVGGAKVVGYCSFGRYRLSPGDDKTMDIGELAEPGTVGEVYGFYLHPDHWGTGAAQELMDESISALINDGWPEARLWVLGANTRARRFYERNDWSADGGRQPLAIIGRPMEVRYRRAL